MKFIPLILLTALNVLALEGKVISIADGDILTILTAYNQQIKVRFQGIDTPEKNQESRGRTTGFQYSYFENSIKR